MTQGEIRFTKFLESIKDAKDDKDILIAGWTLVENYRGFGYHHISQSTLEKFDIIINKTKQNGKSKS